MIPKFPLLGTLFLATLALADHPSQPGAPLVRRDENLQSQSLGRVESRAASDVQWNTASAGSSLVGKPFNYITAEITVPKISNGVAALRIALTLDATCETGSLLAGMTAQVVGSTVTWSTWCQWRYDPPINVGDPIIAGDTITISLQALSPTVGIVTWENPASRVTFLQTFDTTSPLCAESAGWTVQTYVDSNGQIHPLANFDTVTFAGAMAKADNDDVTYLPSGPSFYTLYGISQGDTCLTSTTVDGATLVVKHA